MENNEIIDDNYICQACENSILKYMTSQRTLKIKGLNIPLSHRYGVRNFFLTPKYDLAQVLNKILRNEDVEVSFNIKCQVFEKLGNGDATILDIRGNGAITILSKDDKLNFELESIYFSKDGL